MLNLLLITAKTLSILLFDSNQRGPLIDELSEYFDEKFVWLPNEK